MIVVTTRVATTGVVTPNLLLLYTKPHVGKVLIIVKLNLLETEVLCNVCHILRHNALAAGSITVV